MKSIFTIILTFFSIFSFSQRYNLTQTDQTFTPLTNAITLDLPDGWDEDQVQLTLPFSYSFYGSTPTNIVYVFTNTTFTDTEISPGPPLPIPQQNFIDLYGGNYDLVQKVNTTVKYKIEGIAPNRKLTVEYLNAGFFDIAPEDGNISIQNTITEQGCFSIHLGNATATNPQSTFLGAVFGIYSSALDSVCYASAEGSSLVYADGLGDATLESILPLVNFYPGENKIIEFCPRSSLSTNKIENTAFSVFPNPSHSFIQFDEIKNNSVVNFYDFTGKLVKQLTQINALEQVDISDLTPGIYLLKSISKDGKTQTLTLSKK